MLHPFEAVMPAGEETTTLKPTRRGLLVKLGAAVAALLGLGTAASAQGRRVTTQALGEEGGGRFTTFALGEEGGRVTTFALGEEGSGRPWRPTTTYPAAEEGGGARRPPGARPGARPFSQVPGVPPVPPLPPGEFSTFALGEEG